MKKLTTALLFIALITVSISCKKDRVGEGPVTTETRTVANFTAIDLRMNGNVFYKVDSVFKIEVTAKQSIHRMLETYAANNSLVVKYNNGKTYDNDESIRITVSAPAVNSFILNTSGNIYSTDDINTPNLFLRSSGSGSIGLKRIFASNVNAESNQSGSITATGGNAVSQNLKTDGSGKIDLSAVAVKNTTARIVGSGDIKVKVSDNLDATINGSGDIFFSGYPLITTHISGSGRLIRF